MNFAIGMVLPAAILSCLVACALALATKAPPRLRFWLSVIGLAAWVFPWALIHRAATLNVSSGSIAALAMPAGRLAGMATELSNQFVSRSAAMGSFLQSPTQSWLIALFVPGLLWFGYDCLSYRRTAAAWRRSSRQNESLREWLPEPLRNIRAAIHVVSNSRVAAATGTLRPDLWIGDQFTATEGLEATLTHECCHIRRRDPLRLAIVGFVARVYCWNPFVVFFARQARFYLEASCDQECSRLLGNECYKNELARMILRANEVPQLPRFVPTASTRSHNLLRVRLLETDTRIGMRLYLALGLCLIGGFFSAALAVHLQDPPAGQSDASLQALLVWRNGSNGDRFWQTTGDRREDTLRIFNFWERVGDHILIRKDTRLFYVDDPATVKGARAALEEVMRQTAPMRQRVHDEANTQMLPDVRRKVPDLASQQKALWEQLQPVPGGFGNPDDALFEQLDKLQRQIEPIWNEEYAKVTRQHPEWRAETEKIGTAWMLQLRAIASAAVEKGLARPKP